MVDVSSRISGSTERSPAIPEMTIGKKAMRTATKIFGSMPNPSQTTNSGAMAILGMTWANRMIGYMVFSSDLEYTISTATISPSTKAMKNPRIVSMLVTVVCWAR